MHIQRFRRFAASLALSVGLLGVQVSTVPTSVNAASTLFNHPVLVEGNCDSPVPGTTIVAAGTCGDFDGDTRIGTAEDTDGADRIFGTLAAAIGPGTGAAAGTGANNNGRVLIVKSGRFSEALVLNAASGNLQIEAAPGVSATLDAVLQGDPAGGNTGRQAGPGIVINTPAASRVLLRNLTLRNWLIAVDVQGDSQVTIDDCRIENNRDYGVRATGNSRVSVTSSFVTQTGFRIPVSGPAAPGAALSTANTAQLNAETVRITDNVIGVLTEGTSTVRMSNLAIFNNGTGITRNGTTSVLASFLNNKIRGNGTDGTPTLNLTNQ